MLISRKPQAANPVRYVVLSVGIYILFRAEITSCARINVSHNITMLLEPPLRAATDKTERYIRWCDTPHIPARAFRSESEPRHQHNTYTRIHIIHTYYLYYYVCQHSTMMLRCGCFHMRDASCEWLYKQTMQSVYRRLYRSIYTQHGRTNNYWSRRALCVRTTGSLAACSPLLGVESEFANGLAKQVLLITTYIYTYEADAAALQPHRKSPTRAPPRVRFPLIGTIWRSARS